MHRGYTKRWRKRWDKGYHKDPLLWVMMDYFIDFANWQDNEFPFFWKGALVKMVKVKRGQCLFTYKGLADYLDGPLNPVSRKMVRRRAYILEEIGFLGPQQGHQQGYHQGHQKGHKYQVVTVLNYDKYNPLSESEGRHQGRGRDTNRDAAGTLRGHKGDTTKEYKEYNNNNKIASNMPEYKESNLIEYENIIKETIKYLNQEANVKFNPTTYATQTIMVDRINEGATLADFKAVINKKVSQWLPDEKMAGNLAPTTLFAADKFEKYLQEASRNGGGKKPKAAKLSGIQLLGLGFDILNKFGKEKFNQFCKQNKLSAIDIDSIQDRYDRETETK